MAYAAMVLFDRQAWSWFIVIAKPLFQSERRWQAYGMFALLVVLLFSISGANVVSSFIQQYFMTALADRNSGGFYRWGLIYVGMFVFKGLWLTAGLYAALVVLAVLGWRQWRGRGIAVSPG